MLADRVARGVTRTWRGALIGALLGALVGYGSSHLAPAEYDAHADVLLLPTTGTPARDAVDNRVLSSYAIVLGGRRIAGVVQEDVAPGWTVGQVDAALTAEVLPDSTVLRVTARHPDAETATELSRGAADAFIDLLVRSGSAIDPSDDTAERPAEGGPLLVATVSEQSPPSSSPASPWRIGWALWGVLVGAVLGLLLSLARQLTDRRVRTPEDLAELTEAPLLGAVGYDRSATSSPLVSDLDSHHPRFEAARILRTNLQFLDVDRDQSVVTVTSCLPDEGKSTLAANVAIAIARGGQSVVLVEGDLRRPRLAEMFDLPAGVGLTTTLVGQVELEEAVQETSVPGLDVLTSGTRPPNPAELLATQAMDDLLTQLSRRYDVVLIDAPPLLPVTDAAVLANLTDGAVLVVRHGKATRDQVRGALARLDAVGARVLGTVLTMVPARSGSRYGYGYSYSEPSGSSAGGEGRRARR